MTTTNEIYPINPEDWVITQPNLINTSQIFLPQTITTTTSIDPGFITSGAIFPQFPTKESVKSTLAQALKAKISRADIDIILNELEVEILLEE